MPVASLNISSDQTQETRVLDIEWVVFFAPRGVARNQDPNPLAYTRDTQCGKLILYGDKGLRKPHRPLVLVN